MLFQFPKRANAVQIRRRDYQWRLNFFAFSAMVFHSPWSGCTRPAVQLAQPGASNQPVVIPAEAGIQASFSGILDSRLRGNDASTPF
jgi:hypothetical protein